MIHLMRKRNHCQDIFTSNEKLTVFEMHAYELLKLLRSITQNHAKEYSQDLFLLRTFSTIDSAVSSKSAEGSRSKTKTYQVH